MKNFLAAITEFFTREPNFKALFTKTPEEAQRKMLSPYEKARKRSRHNIFFFLFLPLSIFYIETVYRFSLGGGLPITTLLIIFLFLIIIFSFRGIIGKNGGLK